MFKNWDLKLLIQKYPKYQSLNLNHLSNDSNHQNFLMEKLIGIKNLRLGSILEYSEFILLGFTFLLQNGILS